MDEVYCEKGVYGKEAIKHFEHNFIFYLIRLYVS